MKKGVVSAVLLCCLVSLLQADDTPLTSPTSAGAVAAIAKHDKALAAAQKAFDAAKVKADQDLISDLRRAQTTAEHAGSTAEVNAITSLIEQTKSGSINRTIRLMFLIKGTAEIIADDKPVATAHKNIVTDTRITITPLSVITIRAQSEVQNRCFKLALVDDQDNVLRSFSASEVGLQSQQPASLLRTSGRQSCTTTRGTGCSFRNRTGPLR